MEKRPLANELVGLFPHEFAGLNAAEGDQLAILTITIDEGKNEKQGCKAAETEYRGENQ